MARRCSVTVVIGSTVYPAGTEIPADVEIDASLVENHETPEQVDGQPAGNAATDEWAAYARTLGAADSDLVDADGKPLGRDALRDKYGK